MKSEPRMAITAQTLDLTTKCLNLLTTKSVVEALGASAHLPVGIPFCDLIRGMCLHAADGNDDKARCLVLDALKRDPDLIEAISVGGPQNQLPASAKRTLAERIDAHKCRTSAEFKTLRSFGNMRLRGWVVRTAHSEGMTFLDNVPILPSVEQPESGKYLVCHFDGRQRKMMNRYVQCRYGMSWAEYLEFFELPRDLPGVSMAYAYGDDYVSTETQVEIIPFPPKLEE